MESVELQERAGMFSRVMNLFGHREDEFEDEGPVAPLRTGGATIKLTPRYTVSIRRQLMSLEDAQAAADGLLHGEQQILNLSGTEPVLRNKVIDFLSGVHYAQRAVWEEIGENIYLLAPSHAHVEVMPSTPRMKAQCN